MEAKAELISIIVPNYNGRAHLGPCLRSLLDQSYPFKEVIVADNGSEDDSVAYVRELFPQVKVLSLGRNFGFGRAVNLAFQEAQGQFIATFNNDTVIHPQCLKEWHHAMKTWPQLGICAAKMLFLENPEIINSAGMGYNTTGINHDIGFGLADGPLFQKPTLVFGACSGAAFYRREMLEEVGLFDEDFFMYYEDVDLSFRAQLMGYEALFVPTAVVYHLDGGSSQWLKSPKTYFTARNSLMVIVKNFPAPLLIKSLPSLLLGFLRQMGGSLLKRGEASALLGYLNALPWLPRGLKKRRSIQRRRRVDLKRLSALLKANRDILKRVNLGGREKAKVLRHHETGLF